jgi:propionyl-CoA synthetase
MSLYHATYASWQQNPLSFWGEQAKAIDWFKAPTKIFDENQGAYGRWFVDGTCNTCYNAVDRHALATPQRPAIIYDSPVAGLKKTFTYQDVLREVETLAAVLFGMGIKKGDTVIIYMPMIPEGLFAMLACARIGAVHSVVFGGFAAKELATRIDDCKPVAILAASCGLEGAKIVPYKPLLDGAIALSAHKPRNTLVLQRPQLKAEMGANDLDWADALIKHKGENVQCVHMCATDPLYVLYTSGTTGIPKGVVRDNGGHMVSLFWSMENIYGMKSGDIYWAASDIGWVVGHSYIVYAPLLKGCTTILYEGKPVGTPDPGAFYRMIEEHKINALFTAPTAFRAIKKEDPEGVFRAKYDTSSLRTLFLAGERADPDTITWAANLLNVPVVDHWWQTETGWTIAGNPVGLGLLPIKLGSPTVPMPGYDVQVLDEGGKPVARGVMGTVTVKLPLPPGSLPTLYNNDARFIESYLAAFPGYYNTSDAGYIDEDGYLYIMGRTDDIINVAGHRLSTGGMEEVLSGHPDVAECAVIGMADELKGEIPCGFLVLKNGVAKTNAEIEKECVALIRDKIGPVAAFKLAVVISRLPKTRSGKILRGTMKKIADKVEFSVPATIDDPAILDEIKAALIAKGAI